MQKYASWDNPLKASDWNIRNAERIGRAVENIAKGQTVSLNQRIASQGSSNG